MRRNSKELLQKARAYAFLLLKFRLRSEKELYQRLKRKKFDEEEIKETIRFLKDKGFLDDRLFAQSWSESRLKRTYGPKKIKEELRLKGISKEIIDAELERAKSGYPEEEAINRTVGAQFEKIKGLQTQIIKRRLYGYLMRRGFSSDLAVEAINKICRQIP